MMGAFTCPYCKTKNACNCTTCSKYITEGEPIVKYTEDGEFFICANCDKVFTPDQALDEEWKKIKEDETNS
jgi:hypothetical protein